MRTSTSKREDGGRTARSVLECGSPLPLLTGHENCHALKSAGGPPHSKTWRQFVAAFLFVALPFAVKAQSYSIDWHTLDGGGGTSTGGVHSVSGTIGQPDAGTMSGGNFTLQGGFWGVALAVQTPGAPGLSVMRMTNNNIVVTWPAPALGWVLERTNVLTSASVPWPQVPPPYPINGTNCWMTFTNVPPGANQFFRLHKP